MTASCPPFAQPAKGGALHVFIGYTSAAREGWATRPVKRDNAGNVPSVPKFRPKFPERPSRRCPSITFPTVILSAAVRLAREPHGGAEGPLHFSFCKLLLQGVLSDKLPRTGSQCQLNRVPLRQAQGRLSTAPADSPANQPAGDDRLRATESRKHRKPAGRFGLVTASRPPFAQPAKGGATLVCHLPGYTSTARERVGTRQVFATPPRLVKKHRSNVSFSGRFRKGSVCSDQIPSF